jgi:hypothetical protein
MCTVEQPLWWCGRHADAALAWLELEIPAILPSYSWQQGMHTWYRAKRKHVSSASVSVSSRTLWQSSQALLTWSKRQCCVYSELLLNDTPHVLQNTPLTCFLACLVSWLAEAKVRLHPSTWQRNLYDVMRVCTHGIDAGMAW